MKKHCINVKFWGVRGSSATSKNKSAIYGTNTPCVEILVNNHLIILDAGTGIYPLGEYLLSKNKHQVGHIFISHPHYDHIQGLPFFVPFYDANNTYSIYGEQKLGVSFENILINYMKKPYFPISWNDFSAKTTVFNIVPKEIVQIDAGISVSSIRVKHPGGNLAFRIDAYGKSCCYITDIEHREDNNSELANFACDADVLIYDASLTSEEHSQAEYNGWGHSTWSVATKLAKDANIEKLILFHHSINKSDDEILNMQNQARAVFPNTFAAYEGLELKI
ncbi:MAG: MBL fold metallo-hydrolase [Alkaliphilus sp.]